MRRIKALLEQAGAIECRLVEDDEHQARGTDVRLLELPRPSPKALARAEDMLERWTRERGAGWLAGVEAYRAKARRFDDVHAKVGGEGALPAGFLQSRSRFGPNLSASARVRARADHGNGTGEEKAFETFA